MPLLPKHKIFLITTLCLFALGENLKAQKNITSTYVGFNLCEIASYTITLNPNKKFEQHYTGHLLTNSIQKGKWQIHNDTLALQVNNAWQKFIVFNDSICFVRENDDLCKQSCLKKQISK